MSAQYICFWPLSAISTRFLFTCGKEKIEGLSLFPPSLTFYLSFSLSADARADEGQRGRREKPEGRETANSFHQIPANSFNYLRNPGELISGGVARPDIDGVGCRKYSKRQTASRRQGQGHMQWTAAKRWREVSTNGEVTPTAWSCGASRAPNPRGSAQVRE